MSVYDRRFLSDDNRPSPSRFFPEIVEWWTPTHDAELKARILEHHWLWHWGISARVQEMTDPEVLNAWKAIHKVKHLNIWYNAIMYHSVWRAEQLGLTSLIRKAVIKICPICGEQFSEDSVPGPFVKRTGMNRINFCAPCLNDALNGQPTSVVIDRNSLLAYLKGIAEALNRIPSQDMEKSVEFFQALSDEERLRMLKAMRNRPSTKAITGQFGSWFNALCEAGLLGDGTRRLIIGTQCRANDGDICSSLAEKTIDDLLYALGIQHVREPRYPEGRFRADFRVGEVLVEYYGLAGDREYDANLTFAVWGPEAHYLSKNAGIGGQVATTAWACECGRG